MTRIRIEKLILTAGQNCGPCEFLDYVTINTTGRAWCCNAFDRRLSVNVPAGTRADNLLRSRDRATIGRCDKCLAFDKETSHAS